MFGKRFGPDPRWLCGALVVGAAAVPTSLASAQVPSTLTGERLSSVRAEDAGVNCNPDATSTFSYSAAGDPTQATGGAFGPYAGSFSETGDSTVGPQPPYPGGGSFPFSTPLLGFTAHFTIDSPAGHVEGDKHFQAQFSSGACREVTDIGNARFVGANLPLATYTAEITTSDGARYRDHGTTAVNVSIFRVEGAVRSGQLGEDFTSALSEPEPLSPTSKEQCDDDGWKAFGVFKNHGDRVSFVKAAVPNEPGGQP
jgi:hypothetical protein